MDELKINLAKSRFQQAEDELEAAKTLFKSKHFKSSLSNSYYAIFHSVRTVFAFERIDSKRHTGVIHLFIQNFIKTGLLKNDMQVILSNAFQIRLESDYKDFYVVSKEEAQRQLNNAGLFLNEIKEFVKDHYLFKL